MLTETSAPWAYNLIILALLLSAYAHLAWKKEYLYIFLSLAGTLCASWVVLMRVDSLSLSTAWPLFLLINASFVMVSVVSSWSLSFYLRVKNARRGDHK
ncbi:hypothetical protein [Acerihabitans arboris]|uniref:Uncharacterized protein n=1 Tax=Acerihabitans arboris TaxID=2691583 RepID=A0A845SSI8_9GAMM|nr:hypothetical protein [Acerihabitans arboris]NDL65816.1 hypothetical protein [Acerihabitans arboris]